MKKIVILFCWLLFLVNVLFSQQVQPRLDSFFNDLFHYGQLNGNVLIAQGDTVLYKQSFGYADYAAKNQ